MNDRHWIFLRRALLLLLLGAAGGWARAAEPVADVTFSIGQSQVLRADQHLVVTRGMALEVGDIIETPEGGHVHLHFVDGAFVTIRPSSRLIIRQYSYDAAHPEQSTVKLELEKGTARAISGAAAHAAQDRFRLNTPLVAIGVRGTDFVTQVRAGAVTAAVNEGTIVVAPFDHQCLVNGLGGCSTSRARVLTADMASVIEYRSHQTAPVVLPGIPKSLDMQGLSTPDPVVPVAQGVNQAPATVNGTSASSQVTALSTYAPSLPADHSLVWGRWTFIQGDANPVPGDSLSVPWTQAANGRSSTVGNFYAGLFRSESGPVVFPSSLGNVSFGLMDSGVTFTSGTGVAQAASTTGGTLGINFAQSSFNTQLGLTSAATGPVSLQASGSVTANGYFFSTTGSSAQVAGAVAQDLHRSGYLFQLPTQSGVLTGLTLWGR